MADATSFQEGNAERWLPLRYEGTELVSLQTGLHSSLPPVPCLVCPQSLSQVPCPQFAAPADGYFFNPKLKTVFFQPQN